MSAAYRQTRDIGGVLAEAVTRVADGVFIPVDPTNRDYQRYLAWVAQGNTPDPPPEPAP